MSPAQAKASVEPSGESAGSSASRIDSPVEVGVSPGTLEAEIKSTAIAASQAFLTAKPPQGAGHIESYD